ncbi:50S ribosomal protein L17 [Imperialibacter roseus]|uniref:Large ribosomal subunit protein bL17 n=1 Tax=Imperialibacter roseus TaxID=1324217 RepID=A0ABZ0IMF6_9BACT|nr:50S ribosomal protein L17 [Imperialibacter roseus]WOK05170.1 50S ribosomal protein L17 [Imperialibacter roseus]
MRHGKKINHLGRTASHRKALLSNMASSLILHKRITTTVAKAKALRKYVEPLITKTKDDSTHNRRIVFSYLQNKYSVQELFGPVAEKTASRPGGYTRIIRLGSRLGDNAEICMMELVDFNELLIGEATAKPKAKRTRRSKAAAGADDAKSSATDAVVVEEAPVAEAAVEEVAAETTEEAAAEAPEEGTDEASADDSAEEEKK